MSALMTCKLNILFDKTIFRAKKYRYFLIYLMLCFFLVFHAQMPNIKVLIFSHVLIYNFFF